MAGDEGLEELLNERLEAEPGIAAKSIVGGRAALLNGNLICAAREDGMLVRFGKGKYGWTLEHSGIVPMSKYQKQT